MMMAMMIMMMRRKCSFAEYSLICVTSKPQLDNMLHVVMRYILHGILIYSKVMSSMDKGMIIHDTKCPY